VTATTVTIECEECGVTASIPVALRADQLALANAPLVDTLIDMFDASHSCPSVGGARAVND
jgi:hypothetical protein